MWAEQPCEKYEIMISENHQMEKFNQEALSLGKISTPLSIIFIKIKNKITGIIFSKKIINYVTILKY